MNGRVIAAARAKVPIENETLLRGYGIYERMRLVRGSVPLLPLHLVRLRQSAAALELELPSTDWAKVCSNLGRRNRIANGVIRVTIGDGFQLVQTDRLPRNLKTEQTQGIAVETLPLEYAAANIKGTSRLALSLAERSSNAEVLLVGRGGVSLETTRANFFVLSDRGIETAASPRVLPGIARGLLLEFARGMGIPIRFRAARLAESHKWKEVFVSNAVRGIRPVIRIDDRVFPLPGNNSVTRQLDKALRERMGVP